MPHTKFVRLEVSPTGDATDLAKRLRKYLLAAQNSAFAHHGVFQVAVSGGSLPATLAKALLDTGNDTDDNAASSDFQFDKWHVYLADERAVPLTHEDSNYRLVKSEWIDKIAQGRGKPKFVPIDPALLDNMEKLADDYQTKLIKEFVHRDSVVVPIFDLVLLGCGPDGHTCSLFPGKPTVRTTTHQDWVLAVTDSPKPPPNRITLSMAVVTHAHRIAFVATGKGKDDIMHQIFDVETASGTGEGGSERTDEDDGGALLPCSVVNRRGRQVTWFTDEAAVAKVERRASFEGTGSSASTAAGGVASRA